MNLKKRIFVFIVALIILISSLPLAAFAGGISSANNSENALHTDEKQNADDKLISLKNTTTSAPLSAVYSDSFFESNRGYDHSLAWLSLCLNLCSWTKDAKSSWGEGEDYCSDGEKENNSELVKKRTENIRDAYSDMDFDSADFYNYDTTLNDSSDKVAYSIATKNNVCDSTLITVVIRGGIYGAEWKSNFNVGSGDGHHDGFYKAALDVYNKVAASYNNTDGKVKLWITGYSRGAAVANILSAMLLDDSLTTEKFDKEDIFAYTFATPQVVVGKEKASDILYSGIYNIINPGDCISLLALDRWGFTRYGTTKFFSPLTSAEIGISEEILGAVNNNYKKISHGSFDAEKNLKQQTLNVALIDILTQDYPTAKSSFKIQKVIQDFMEYSELMKLSDSGGYVQITPSDYEEILKQRHGKNYIQAHLMAELNIKFNDFAILSGILDYDLTLMMLTIGELHGLSSTEMISLARSILSCSQELKNESALAGSLGQIGTGHSPKVYLAWMMQEEHHTFGITENLNTKVMTLSSPVSITVYDESGETAARVENKKILHSRLPIIIGEEDIEIYFSPFNEENYTVEITAIESGTMNYTVTEYNLDGEALRRAIYYDIPLTVGQRFTACVAALTDFTYDKYDLITSTGESISANEVVGEDGGRAESKIDIVGEGRAEGDGSYLKGDTVKLRAYPAEGYIFSGWYIDNLLVCEEENYIFTIKDKVQVRAEFKPCGHVWEASKTIKEATHTEVGEAVFVCEICDSSKTEEIPKIAEHTYGEWFIDKESGERRKACVCGHFVTENTANITFMIIAIITGVCVILGAGFLLYRFKLSKKYNTKSEKEEPKEEKGDPRSFGDNENHSQ